MNLFTTCNNQVYLYMHCIFENNLCSLVFNDIYIPNDIFMWKQKQLKFLEQASNAPQ